MTGTVLPSPENPRLSEALGLAARTVALVPLPKLPECDHDDFFAVARLAAFQALISFDPRAGCSWQSWVITKVRWALSEEKRRWDVNTRLDRKRYYDRENERAEAQANHLPLPEPILLRERPVSLEGLWKENPDDAGTPVFEREEHAALAQPFDLEALVESWSIDTALPGLTPRLQLLFRLRAGGVSKRDTAAAIGVSESRIVQLLAEMIYQIRVGLGEATPRPPSRERIPPTISDTDIAALYRQGLSQERIACQVKCSRNTVFRTLARLRAAGLLVEPPPARRPRPTPRLDAFVALEKAGLSTTEIAGELSLTRDAVNGFRCKARKRGLLPRAAP